MTGKYNFRNYTHFGYLNPKEKTFGQMMQSAGYRTAIAGKWQLNGLSHQAENCDDSTRPHQAGFHEYCLWQLTHTRGGDQGGERFWSPVLEQNGKLLSKVDNEGLYGPDIMSDFVCDFIERNKDAPFFVYYPSVLVHDPFVPTPDTIGDASRDHAANRAPKGAKKQKANFVAMVAYLDKIVGKIVSQLDRIGQLENTLILFTADNGTNVRIESNWNQQVIRGGKGGTTDMGTHVPLVAYWKGKTPSGKVLTDLVDFTDFYPTLAEVAGKSLNDKDPSDGQSFLPQLKGQPGNPREWVFGHYQPYWGSFKGSQYVRNQRFKLYRDGSFFDVPGDLSEENDRQDAPLGTIANDAKEILSAVLEKAPPAPVKKGGRNAVQRPVHSDWPAMNGS